MRTLDIYLISDLHLGGAPSTASSPSFQMCPPESRRRLARFVEAVRTSKIDGACPDADRELIINGDLVDFLAEQPFVSFTADPKAAIVKLREVIKNCDEGAEAADQFFPALRRFVADGHRLTLLLGNHDLELSLPEVRHELLTCLTEGKPARIEFLFDGEACRRGKALIEHGNRYDGWNAVAHGAMRAFRARSSRGEPDYPFTPPAGSRLVAEVINPLKELYRFIDLLKPENEALIPILIALHPAALGQIRRIYDAWRETISLRPGDVPDRESLVGDFDISSDVVPDVLTQVGDRTAVAVVTPPSPEHATPTDELVGDIVERETFRRTEAVFAEAEAWVNELSRQHGDAVPDEYSQVGAGLLAWLRSSLSLIRITRANEVERYQHLRNALAAHRRTLGSTFSLQTESPEYLKAANRLEGPDARFIIFGHTHLPKSIALERGGRYLNTGTWCRTIRLPESFYEPGTNDAESHQRLKQFVDDMRTNRLNQWTNLRTLFVHVIVEPSGATTADLREYHEDGRVTAPTREVE